MIPKPISAKDVEAGRESPPRAEASAGPQKGVRPAAPPAPPNVWTFLHDLFERACRILVFLVLILIPCLYPFQLPDNWTAAIHGGGDGLWARTYDMQIYMFVKFLYHPLRLKEGAFCLLVVVLVLCWFLREVSRILAGTNGAPSPRRFDWAVYGPIAALLLWSAATLFYAPTFYWSLTTYALMIAGVLWFIVIFQMPKSQQLVRRWFNAVLLAGGVVGFFAFLQDVDGGRITGKLFVDIKALAEKGDPTILRLRMGSLIGHNIGVASLLSFSWFIVLGRLFQPSSVWRKALWAVLLAFLFYVIMAAQTRGIWIVLAVLTPCHFIWLMRLTGRRWDLRPILGVILIGLIVITLQGIESPRNPFWSPESPLRQRFTHFSPSHLLTETRLRIAACSGSLVASRPLRGHGLGTFQYVYPRAQAEYFTNHPDTILAPTAHRTMRAHNDWLQVLIELGLPGLLLVLGGLYMLLRRGWNEWLLIHDPTLRVEMTAAVMAVGGQMIHALGNFPIHVVSTAAPVIFFLAIWASCGRIGAPATPLAPAKTTPRKRTLAAASAAAVFPAALLAAAWVYFVLQVGMYETIGTAHRIYYGDHAPEMTYAERQYQLGRAYAYLHRGHRLCPLNREIVFRLGEVSALAGVAAVHEAERIGDTDNETSRLTKLALLTKARGDLQRAVGWLRACQDEVRYHEVYHYLGLCFEYFHHLYGGEGDRQLAKQFYRRAIQYSPSFSSSLLGLFRLLQKDVPPNPEELRRVYRAIARYDPLLFRERFTRQVWEAMDRRDYEKAVQTIGALIDVNPEHPALWLKQVHLLAYTGRSAGADVRLDDIRQRFPQIQPEHLAGYRMETAAAGGRYAEALALATAVMQIPGNEGLTPYNRCVRAAVLEKLNRPEAQAEWEDIEKLADSRYTFAAVEVYYFLLRDPKGAFPWLMKACAIEDPRAPPAFFRIAAGMLYERGEKAKALEFLEEALERDPEDPMARKLLQEFEP